VLADRKALRGATLGLAARAAATVRAGPAADGDSPRADASAAGTSPKLPASPDTVPDA